MGVRITLLIVTLLSAQATLAGGMACDDLGSVPVTNPILYEQDIQPIFNDRCTGCHNAGHSTGLDLQAGASYGLLVNVESSQDGSWLRVEPSSLANSLLFHKINCDDPPVGDRMPTGDSLTLAEQALIRDWIEQGALNLGDLIFTDRFEDNSFRDCPDCPAMVVIPGGSFTQGSPASEAQSLDNERPQRTVNVPAFAMGQYSVTFDEWGACVADDGCTHNPGDQGWGRGSRPVINVNWNDAQEYVDWLSNKTGHDYRLPSESEWEYATRAGTTGRFNTGDCITTNQANFRGTVPADGCPPGIYREQTLPVGSFAANAFGLYDTHGNVFEWVEDCWNGDYAGAPTDGSAWMSGDCSRAVLRGGSWGDFGDMLRSAYRYGSARGARITTFGFRVARSVTL